MTKRESNLKDACLIKSDMERYAAGKMADAESARIRRHLESCPACRMQIELLAGDSEVVFGRIRQAMPGGVDAGDPQATRAADEEQDVPKGVAVSIEGYDIVRELHRGGQGIVYQAVQKSTKRKVAIKVLLEGAYASKSSRRRFEREIELVAQLKHPNIISIFHSGQTTDGHPYCVMDYVRGVSLDRHVREKKLTLEEALKLFAKVCDAVNYAHQKGVIHRDIKPSNILVDVDGTPKVLDFGLAKQTIAPEQSLVSVTGQVVGTLPYMSPEQARGNPDEIDTRTDIYALGVVLYELLTGHYPYPVVGQMAEVLNHIAETEPTPPSRSWKTDSGITRRTSKKLRAGECPIDDEVQTIVLKALSKERQRRYQSARDLGGDIGRYLANEPIEAKRDSGWYVLKKQLSRYKLPFAVAASFVVVITVSLVISVSLWRKADRLRERAEREASRAGVAEAEQSRERQRAENERDKAEVINEFVTKALVSSDPHEGGAQGFLVTDAMAQAVALLDGGELKDQPETEAALRLTISEILNGNARPQEALRLARRALEINERLHPGDHRHVAWSLNNVASCLRTLGRSAEALPKYEAALQMKQRLFDGDHPDVAQGLSGVASCLQALGRSAEALPKYKAALDMHLRNCEGDHPYVARSLGDVASCLRSLGRSAEALPNYEAALEMSQRLFEGDHPDMAQGLNNLAFCLQSLGRSAEALPKYEAALEMRQRLFEGDHPGAAGSLNNLAACLRSLGRSAEALPKFEAALEMHQRLYEGDHPGVAQGLNNVASCLHSLGRSAEALPKFEAALEMYQRLFGGDHPDVAQGLNNLAGCLQSLGRSAEALPKYEAALEMSQRLFEGDHPDVAWSLNNVAGCLRTLGRKAEALPKYEAALQMNQRLFERDHPDVALGMNNVASCLKSMRRSAEALPKYEAALEMRQRLFEGDHPSVAASLNNVATCLRTLGRPADALPRFEASLEMHQRLFEGDHPSVAASLNNVATCLRSLARSAEALPTFKAALQMHRRILPPGHPNTLHPQIGLAKTLLSLGRHAEAESLLLDAAEQCARFKASRRMHGRSVAKTLAGLYDAWHEAEPAEGYDIEAAEWRAKLPATSKPASQPAKAAPDEGMDDP